MGIMYKGWKILIGIVGVAVMNCTRALFLLAILQPRGGQLYWVEDRLTSFSKLLSFSTTP